MKRIVLLLISLTALFSCSVKGSLNLEADGAGSMDMSFTLAPYFGDFFNDLADADQLVAETDKSMKENPAVTSHTIDSSEKYRYSGTFTFDDFEKMMAPKEGEEQTVFVMEKRGNETTLRITFTRENWEQMSVLVPIFSDPTIAMLGPSGSIGLTEEEYREMVIYPFEGYASSLEEAQKGLDDSSLVFTVTLPGTIISQKGGTVSGRTVTYRIPLIRMLMLDQSLTYSVTYIQE
ncbi:MAG: hypothetical protein JXA95_12635 [Spirochaetales bacterium]|nr:hypothetical protein [Spirochaetales bacterium]